ncbi:MAG: cation transporter [Candidatus Dormibacteraeota bacterium]|nr:cation transporter [Candidatus Dormibacteraeota bacterium]
MATDSHDHIHADAHEGEPAGLHVHDHGLGHVHGVAMPVDGGALRVVGISSVLLATVAALELSVSAISNSAGVLADGLHNLGDVSTTVALAAAFILSRRAPTKRFPYGYHRGEDLAGLVVLGLIVASAVASGVTSVEHLLHRQPLTNIALALVVAAGGFVGNELAAEYKLRAGRRLRSTALIADGRHSRVDGVASLGAVAGVAGAALGAPILDPVAGLVITTIIAVVAWETGRTVTGRLLDEADASLVSTIQDVAETTEGVLAVTEARARWAGRRVLAELTVEVAPDATLASAHALGEAVRHRLYHRIDPLIEVIVHLDPAGDATAHAAVSHHRR